MSSMRGVLLASAPPPILDAGGVLLRPTGIYLHCELGRVQTQHELSRRSRVAGDIVKQPRA